MFNITLNIDIIYYTINALISYTVVLGIQKCSIFLKQQSHATCLLLSTNQSRFRGAVGKGYASLAEGRMFEFKSRHTKSDSFTAENFSIGLNVRRHMNGFFCNCSHGTLKNPHCSLALNAEFKSKFATPERQFSLLHDSQDV